MYVFHSALGENGELQALQSLLLSVRTTYNTSHVKEAEGELRTLPPRWSRIPAVSPQNCGCVHSGCTYQMAARCIQPMLDPRWVLQDKYTTKQMALARARSLSLPLSLSLSLLYREIREEKKVRTP